MRRNYRTTLYREMDFGPEMEIDVVVSYFGGGWDGLELSEATCKGKPVELTEDEERAAFEDVTEDMQPSGEPEDMPGSER